MPTKSKGGIWSFRGYLDVQFAKLAGGHRHLGYKPLDGGTCEWVISERLPLQRTSLDLRSALVLIPLTQNTAFSPLVFLGKTDRLSMVNTSFFSRGST